MSATRFRHAPAMLALVAGLASPAVIASPMATPIEGDVVLKDAIVHVGDGSVIPRANVVLQGGRIAAVTQDAAGPPGARVIDCRGMHVTPGLFAPDTVIGLVEIGAVRATQDSVEVGRINPHVEAWTAFNPDSELLGVAMANGVLHALVAPRGGAVSGMSAVMRLSGWTREDMALQRPAALDVTWPSMALRRGTDVKPSVDDQQKAIADSLEELDDLVLRARAYHAGRAGAGTIPPLALDLRLDAMKPVLDGTIPVVVHAETVPQMRAALDWGKRHGLRLVLEGARDAWEMAAEIAAAKVPVIVGAVRALPDHDFDAYDTRWERPVLLHRAGVKVIFSAGSSAGNAWAVRNLPEEAAMTIPWGMPPEEALRAITLSPAEAFGVADRVGSVEAGKMADVVVWDGPPLEITSHAVRLFMRGAEIPIADRHTRLYERYKARPR